MSACFDIQNLTFYYPEQTRPVLNDLSLTVEQGAFAVLCGPSGCGKSTLLRQLKTVLAPHGHRIGKILLEGIALEDLDQRTQSAKIGFVQQSPDNQIVTDKVWHELAFGLESLGYDTSTIRRRVAEMASFFGIENWFYKNVTELSGGQKQLLNVAAIMAMQPSVLVLDEPTSQLDPIAASDFLATLGKINRELGTTIILTEHRLEEAFPLASKVVVMDKGTLLCEGTPHEVGRLLQDQSHAMFLAMPTPMRVWASVHSELECPITVKEGREWLTAYAADHVLQPLPPAAYPVRNQKTVIQTDGVWFKYEKDSPDVVRGLSMTVQKSEFLALLGGNGTGKTTTLKLLSGLQKPYRGTITVNGTLAVLPQNPQAMFVKKTVREDLLELSPDEGKVARAVKLCRLEELLERHPYDLSGGEQQRAALAKILLLDPEILLLDEPTKGLDAEFKQIFAEIVRQLLRRGVTILMVSHDIEFCARYAHRCAMFFDGGIVTDADPRTFFSGNSFYTTSANRMARGLEPEAVTAEDLMAVCGGTLPPEAKLPEDDGDLPPIPEDDPNAKPKKLPLWRKILAALSALIAIAGVVSSVTSTDLNSFVSSEGLTIRAGWQMGIYLLTILALVGFVFAIGRRSKPPVQPLPVKKQELSKRSLAATGMVLLLIPLTLFFGIYFFAGQRYYLIALLVLLECMLPFFLVFEGRKPQTRELVVIAVLSAIAVAGRTALFMLPQFKPVLALVIISGVALGGETGFLVGAVTMLVSNMLLGQGVWTPWQMFSAGIIGWLAGVLFRKGLLRRTRMALCVFGALATIVLYGGVMNLSSLLTSAITLTPQAVLSYYITGFPMDCVHAAGTVLFLWLAAEPMMEKLDRIKVKYGLVE